MRLLLASLVLVLGGCVATTPSTTPAPASTTPPKSEPVTARYVPAQWRDLPDWPGQQLQASWRAWQVSCTRIKARAEWRDLCAESAGIGGSDASAMRQFFERRFTPWRIETSTGANEGLITGYYEILMKGGRKPAPGRVPIYGVPDDLLTIDFGDLYPELRNQRVRGRLDGNKVVPYWNRRDIDAGRLGSQGKVLAWADDPVDAFFLQVQGSGRLRLEDGSTLRLGYANQNGHPYRAIGKWLVDQGELPREQVSMQSIREWVRTHPARRDEILQSNPSYVFFKILPASDGGPIGALNVPLTDAASIAVDPRFIPLGSPVYLATTRPDDNAPVHRLVQAQDTGGAIRGPVRADYFWGSGPAAGDLAGAMKQQGKLWLLWPKELPLPAQQ
jgi:membrane-bound lytic murein transglycosylase A